jgi:hypothetical protein
LPLVSVHTTMLLPEAITHLNDVGTSGPVPVIMPLVVMLSVSNGVPVVPSDPEVVPETEPSEPIVNVPLPHQGPGVVNWFRYHVPAKSALEYDAAFLVKMVIASSPPLPVSVHTTILLPESIAHLNDWGTSEPVAVMTPLLVMLKVPDGDPVEPSDPEVVPDNEPSEPIVNVPLPHQGPGESKELRSHVPAKSAIEYDAAFLVKIIIAA